ADENMTNELARLPADYEIEVVAAKNNSSRMNETKYLIKTQLGLLGWYRIQAGKFTAIDVKGILFKGD
ncbi:MAG: hypothetical protein AAGC88_14240, partial [Bacteroidota bacterium]